MKDGFYHLPGSLERFLFFVIRKETSKSSWRRSAGSLFLLAHVPAKSHDLLPFSSVRHIRGSLVHGIGPFLSLHPSFFPRRLIFPFMPDLPPFLRFFVTSQRRGSIRRYVRIWPPFSRATQIPFFLRPFSFFSPLIEADQSFLSPPMPPSGRIFSSRRSRRLL